MQDKIGLKVAFYVTQADIGRFGGRIRTVANRLPCTGRTLLQEPDISDLDIYDEALRSTANKGASAITARLRRAIETGVYSDGDQLPAERQLATAFGAARSTIRKVLDNLEQEGLVYRRVGSGTFVNYAGPLANTVGDVSDLISPLQLIEARFAVEPTMTRLAAIHATRRDLDSIEDVLARLEGCGNDKNAFSRWDSEFHLLLARCSRNPLIVHLYQQINDARSHAQWAAMKDIILTPDQIGAYNNQHRGIYEALTRRDVTSAVQLIEEHLHKARADLVGASSD